MFTFLVEKSVSIFNSDLFQNSKDHISYFAFFLFQNKPPLESKKLFKYQLTQMNIINQIFQSMTSGHRKSV